MSDELPPNDEPLSDAALDAVSAGGVKAGRAQFILALFSTEVGVMRSTIPKVV